MTKQDRARRAAIVATAALCQFDRGTPDASIDSEERRAAVARWRGEYTADDAHKG